MPHKSMNAATPAWLDNVANCGSQLSTLTLTSSHRRCSVSLKEYAKSSYCVAGPNPNPNPMPSPPTAGLALTPALTLKARRRAKEERSRKDYEALMAGTLDEDPTPTPEHT